MQTNRLPRVVLLALALAAGLMSSGCVNPMAAGRSAAPAPSGPSPLGGYTTFAIDSLPSGATISVNGRMIGPAPVNYRVEIDNLGDIAQELDITANFADSPDIPRGEARPTVSHRVARGDRPPTVVTFDTDSASSR